MDLLSDTTRRGQRSCARCLRADCVCACLNQPGLPLLTPVSLLILQHPREQREPKGAARLLHLAVAESRLRTGERWSVAPEAAADGPADDDRLDLLLYPPTLGDAVLPSPPPLPEPLPPPARLRLVVVDATWRKSRRMLCDSPWLQGLPRLALAELPASRYRIRRARGAGQLSTFEATALALAQLQGQPQPAAALWTAFDAFVAQLAARQPVSVSRSASRSE